MRKEDTLRIARTTSCHDADGIPKVQDAGMVIAGNPPVQIMHNGIRILQGAYHGDWMTEIIRRLRGHHEPQEEKAFYEVLKTLPETATMIELGSFWAYYSMWFNKSIKNPTNYLIEPNPMKIEVGRKHFALNQMKGSFFNAFIGKDSADQAVFTDWDNKQYQIPRIALDDFVEKNEIPFLHIVHSDIQGAEYDMLMGCQRSLAQNKIAYFVISTHGHTHTLCMQFLLEHDFVVVASHTIAESVSADGLIVARAKWFPGPERIMISTGEYYSQYKQDMILDHELFKKKENGVFVEVGATDGYHFSNTLFFEKWRGWRGICIEPNPIEFAKLKASDRTCVKENFAISSSEGETNFLAIDGYGKGLSGIVETYDLRHLERIERELEGRDSQKHYFIVKTIPLQKLFDIHHITQVDYCSIDVEGAEMQVLESIDYDKTHITCFTIENNYGLERETAFLESKGYHLWKKVGCDDFFVRGDVIAQPIERVALRPVAREFISKEDARKMINPHHAAFLPFDQPIAMEQVSPEELVTWSRFDVVAKFIYARSRDLGISSEWATRLYEAHERAFNNYSERDGSGKQGVNAFVDSFHRTLDSIKKSGFNSAISAVPVSYQNNLIDGSHRVAACLCYHKPVTILRFDFEGWHYNGNFFRDRGLAEKYCDAIAYEYSRLKDNTHVVLLFPSARGRDIEVRNILLRYTAIIYEKRVRLERNGPLLLMTQVYKDESWLGDFSNRFAGAQLKASECFKGNGFLRIYLVETDQPELLKKAKDEIRNLYGIANHSVHINDTHAETVRICQLLMNQNSIHFLNHASLVDFRVFRRLYPLYQHLLDKTPFDREFYCITGSAVMALYGLRDVQDLDYLHFRDSLPVSADAAINSHNKELKYYPVKHDDIIFSPEYHFYFDGVKFASLDVIRLLKQKRGEEKDFRDLELIAQVFANPPEAALTSIVILNYNGIRHIGPCLESIRRNTPERHEIIVFDNASTDGSRELLRTFRDIILVENETNLGCPPARAKALTLATGDYVIFLDNDTIVTPKWLSTFLAHAARNPSIGIMGPRSNYVSGMQLVQDVPYSDIGGMDAFALQFAEDHRGQVIPTHRLVGFCMFIRRAVIDKIGNIDASFGPFGFEDDDYTWRAIIAGFEVVIANDVFIHHTGGPQGMGDSSYNRQLLDAWEVFKVKWALPPDLKYGMPYNPMPVLTQMFNKEKHYIPIARQYPEGEENTISTDSGEPALLDAYEKIQLMVKDNRQEEAITELLVLSEKYPKAAYIFNDLGVLSGALGKTDDAERYYRKACSLAPRNELFMKNYADFLYSVKQDTVQALITYNEILRLKPDDIETLLVVGNLCLLQGQLKDARYFYRRVLEIKPGDEAARRGLRNVSQMRREARTGRTSIIIMPTDRRVHIEQSLLLLKENTPDLNEVLILEPLQGQDGTELKKKLSELMALTWLDNRPDDGYISRINRAISAATGEYIVLIEDDVMVTEGWLASLLEHFYGEHETGIIGPMIANIEGRQRVQAHLVSPADISDYARTYREIYRHRRVPSMHLANACLLMRKDLLEEIGGLDPTLEIDAAFEDVRIRSELAGYQNVIAADVIVASSGAGRTVVHQSGMPNQQNYAKKSLAVLRAVETADDFYQKGLTDEAVHALVDCIKIAPDVGQLYFELARIFLESKKFSEAVEVVEAMPEWAKEDCKGLECAGYAKEGLGLDEESGIYADRMLGLHDNYAPALNLAGVLAYKRGDREKAGEFFRRAVDSDPGYGEAYTNLGVLQWTSDNRDQAIHNLTRGFILAPTVPDHSTLFYSALSALGRYSDAEVAFRDSRGLYPHNKTVAFLFIDALIQQQKYQLTMEEIEDALVTFGLDDGILAAAVSVREKLGPLSIAADRSKKPSLSLCMIVKNEEDYLAHCLRSVRQVVDEMVVVDTGSTDRTKQIAAVFGAKVHDFAWTGDFSEARNYSLSKAAGDWILILDADEVLSPLDFQELTGLLNNKTLPSAAYTIVTRNYVKDVSAMGWTANDGKYPEEAGTGWFPSPKVRLFARDVRVRFADPVHETLEASLMSAGIPVRPCEVVVHHYGKLNQEREKVKGEHYYDLGKQKLADDPDNLKYLHELATQAQHLDRYEEAAGLWRKLILSTQDKPVADFYFNLGYVEMMLEHYGPAAEASRRALNLDPGLKEAALNLANCELIVGNIEAASRAIQDILAGTPGYPPALLLLAALNITQGEFGAAMEVIALLTTLHFNSIPALQRISEQMTSYGQKERASAFRNALVLCGLISIE